ncbi:hypothetical protein BKA65DRAFT_597084 [Rhexocercosporidium sp. MPI-PUGE-AT-0058]|nr:hypothetical protein BKA65DRAFT_597084 [Rhexocercosporidium sp. MPI-PUGE-AT-0058]
MARDIVDLPEHGILQGLGTLTSKHIRFQLHESRIAHDPKALKADLLALLALFRLGIVNEDHAADPALLVKVTVWCGSLVSALQQELSIAGIDKSANKWFDIENLIRAELEDESDTDDTEDDESDAEASGSSSQVAVFTTEPPTASVMNLLLTSFYVDMVSYAPEFSAAFPGCPVNSAAKFLRVIDEVPFIKDTQNLTNICKQLKTEGDRLVFWMCSTFGSDIIKATEDSGLKVPGFPNSVCQFVLARPAPVHRETFAEHLKQTKIKPMLLFHGTPMRHLQSILRNGFSPAANQRFGAELFMAKTRWNLMVIPERNLCTNPMKGCQVTGQGRPVYDGQGVHVIKQLDSIAVRYNFLLPLTRTLDHLGVDAPGRALVEPAMTTAFKAILEDLGVLRSIIRNDFTGSCDRPFGNGLFVAEDLATSWNYAYDQWQHLYKKLQTWHEIRYKKHGLLIGCNVLGQVHPVDDLTEMNVHVIKSFASIMPQYCFLFPPQVHESIHTRAQVEPTMLAAFCKIKDGLDASYYKGSKMSERILDSASFFCGGFPVLGSG